MAPNTAKQSLVHDGRNAVGAGDIAVFVLANILSAFADMADTVAAELFGLFRFQAPVIERIFDLTDALTTVVASENLRHQRHGQQLVAVFSPPNPIEFPCWASRLQAPWHG